MSTCLALPVTTTVRGADKKPPKRTPTTEVKVFRDGDLPKDPVKELGGFTDDGGLDEEESIVGKFIQKAKKAGAEVLVLDPLKPSGAEVKPFSFGAVRTTYLYRGRAYYYDSGGDVLRGNGSRSPTQLPPTTRGDQSSPRGSGSAINTDGYC